MIFFWGETPDGWGIPGLHGPYAEDELDGYVQSGVYLIRGQGENALIDSGNWTLPEYQNGMGDFLVEKLDQEKNDLKYLILTHFHYDHCGNAKMIKERYGAQVVCHPHDRPIIEDPFFVLRREMISRFGIEPEDALEDFNLAPGESLGLSDPAMVERYWNFPVEVDLEVEHGDDPRCRRAQARGRSTCPATARARSESGIRTPARSIRRMSCITRRRSDPIRSAMPRRTARRSRSASTRSRSSCSKGHGLSAYSEASARRRLLHMQEQQKNTRDRILQVLRRVVRPQTISELLPEVMPIKTDLDYAVSTGKGMRRCYAEAASRRISYG